MTAGVRLEMPLTAEAIITDDTRHRGDVALDAISVNYGRGSSVPLGKGQRGTPRLADKPLTPALAWQGGSNEREPHDARHARQ
jgi:hypothetical protein